MATTQSITVTLQPNGSGGWSAKIDGQTIQSVTIEREAATLTFVLESADAVFAGVDCGSDDKPVWISDPYQSQSHVMSVAIANNEPGKLSFLSAHPRITSRRATAVLPVSRRAIRTGNPTENQRGAECSAPPAPRHRLRRP